MLQLQRARLSSDYLNIIRSTKRAHHEMDITAIDLRAAEMRRKVADGQMEKAKAGALGIDYVHTA
jgi:hypothetical protein